MAETSRGLIFNQVQGSFVDGWGIRTTVFLKGCPLKCKWCCNPEGQSFAPELKVTYAKCDGCGRCEALCPQKALTVQEGKVVVDRNACNVCGQCGSFCWTGALELFGRYYTVEEMFQYLQRDAAFYAASGGGVTIGGGEATWHPNFVLPLMKKLHEAGIPVAVDTCGYVDTSDGLQVLKEADLVLFDIKGMEPERHLKNTGVSNELIWRNLRMLGALEKDIIIRIPVIPGHTDDEEELRQAAEALTQIPTIRRVDILPVHQFGKIKYEQIGMEYAIDPTLKIPEERQKALKTLFESYGFQTQLGG